MSSVKPYVVPGRVVKTEPDGPHHVRLVIYPEGGPSVLHPVVFVVNRVARPDWAGVAVGTIVRIGMVLQEKETPPR